MVEFDVGDAAQIETAALNSKMVGFLSLEVCGTALAAGLYSHSLATGLIVFAALYLMFSLETLKHALALVVSLFWGTVVFYLVDQLAPAAGVAWSLAGVMAVASLGAHIRLFRWQREFD